MYELLIFTKYKIFNGSLPKLAINKKEHKRVNLQWDKILFIRNARFDHFLTKVGEKPCKTLIFMFATWAMVMLFSVFLTDMEVNPLS